MKRFLMVAMAVIVAIGCMASKPPKNDDKSLWKDAQKMAKDLTKQGWIIDGSKTLEVALYEHKIKLRDTQNGQELLGQAIGIKEIRTRQKGQSAATTNACNLYAKQARQMVAGRVNNEMGYTEGSGASPESFYEGYESKVAKEIQGELKRSFGIFREKDGHVDYQIFFVIDEDEASKARMRAMENALRESEFARKHAEEISDFVRKGFTIEQ